MAGIPGFDALVSAARSQVETLLALPGDVAGAVAEVKSAAQAVRRVAERADALLDEVEDPVRRAGPTLDRLNDLLSDPMLADAQETLRRVREEVLPALRAVRETQQRVATLASSTDRLSGAAALLMRRTTRPPEPPVIDVEP